MPIRMRQQQDRLLRMVDEITGQAGLIVNDEGNAVCTGNIFGGDDDKFVPRNAGAESDVLDLAARNLTADGSAVEHVGQNHVVHVLRLSGYFLGAFLAWNRCADNAISRHVKILWSLRTSS